MPVVRGWTCRWLVSASGGVLGASIYVLPQNSLNEMKTPHDQTTAIVRNPASLWLPRTYSGSGKECR